MEAITKTANREEKTLSQLIMMLLEDYQRKHGDGNPAFTLDYFDHDGVIIIPSIGRSKKTWRKYYEGITTEKEYKYIDEQLNMIIKIHNENFTKFK